MVCRIHFFLCNDHFSQEYADTHNKGEASELNRKYLWEDEFLIKTTVSDVESKESDSYVLQGEKNGVTFSEKIPNMRMFYLKHEDVVVALVGCSEVLLKCFDVEHLEEEIVIRVYMKGEEPLANPLTGIYISSADFPKTLISE